MYPAKENAILVEVGVCVLPRGHGGGGGGGGCLDQGALGVTL